MKSNSNAMEQVTMAPIFPPGTGLGMKTLHNISERPKSDENAWKMSHHQQIYYT